MIQLYDFYHRASRDLAFSLKQAGYEGPIVVVNDDGFLPAEVLSPYAYFCQFEGQEGEALYFNQLPVPEYWEIRGNHTFAEVLEYGYLRAKIFYAEPKHHRFIKRVDWYDQLGQVKLTEHYNQYGWKFATSSFTSEQKIAMKTYYNHKGQEILVENALTGDIILNWQGRTMIFANRVAFLNYYFELMDFNLDTIIYNSLSTPFFYAYSLSSQGQDYLFWQEDIGDSIPGNMKVLLANQTRRTQTILVQNRQVYDRILSLVTDEEKRKISYLGFLYPEKKVAQSGQQALIVTNSDEVEGLDQLTSSLSEVDFHIAALTEMSPKLLGFDRLSNVHLYPNSSEDTLLKLYEKCQLYLDINRGKEVFDATRRAFEYNLLILGFQDTRHQQAFGLASNYFSVDRVDDLVSRIRQAIPSLAEMVAQQRHQGTCPEDYQQVLGK